jgi:hypothetical protein
VVVTTPKQIGSAKPGQVLDAVSGELLVSVASMPTPTPHTVAVVDQRGGLLGHASFPATAGGFDQLHRWLIGHVGLLQSPGGDVGLDARHLDTGPGVRRLVRPRVETRKHRAEVNLGVDHDPVALTLRAGDVAVEAHRGRVHDFAYAAPPLACNDVR